MFKLPHIPRAEELIDNAFRAGSSEARRARSTGKRREIRLKQSDLKRVEFASKVIEGNLNAVVKKFPSFEDLSPFYQNLLDIKVDRNKYKKSLGAVNWCLDKVKSISRKELKDIKRGRSEGREFLGRASSLIKRIEGDLDFLIEVKRTMLNFPLLEDVDTLVVAGFPNVGKSTFVRNLTGSKIEVRRYPFTTKDILIGHVNIRHVKYQVIDSPGLLERPMEKRNRIELQAITALKYLARKILFIIDPTQKIETQINLFNEVSSLFNVDVIVGINKVDVVDEKLVESIEGLISGYNVFRFTANNPGDCLGVFKAIYGKN